MDDKGTYYTPREVLDLIDPAAGTGGVLARIWDEVIQNPPYDSGETGVQPESGAN